jgi:wyosine [tRNA(Phe)-imidazoG37] synthetase (radical SAM superfamily)
MNVVLQRLDASDHSRQSAGLTYVYPVVSRRAGGVSVGVNLNPNNACNWRCVYCQVPNLKRGSAPAIDLGLLERELRGFLQDILRAPAGAEGTPEGRQRIMDIALSGNGEPTSAREFPAIVDLIIRIMSELGLSPQVKARLITNGSLLARAKVQQGVSALGRCAGEVWFKVDAGTEDGYARINSVAMTPERVVRNLRRCADLCATWVQTCMFAVSGEAPTKADLDAYLKLLAAVGANRLQGVLLYGLARPSMQPEASRLSPLSAGAMELIAERIRALGLTVHVSP